MTANAQTEIFGVVPQPTWVRPKTRGGCGRDPAAGPGSCFYWWDTCPKAAQRGCYALWQRNQTGGGQ